MDWQETLDFLAQDILSGAAPMTSDEYERKLRERVDESLADREDYTFVGVPHSEIEAAITDCREMYF